MDNSSSIGPYSGGEDLYQTQMYLNQPRSDTAEYPLQFRLDLLPPVLNDNQRKIEFLRATSIKNEGLQKSIQEIKNLNTFPNLKTVKLCFDDYNDTDDNEASIVLDDLMTTLEAEVPVLQQELDKVSIKYHPITTGDPQDSLKGDLPSMLRKIVQKFPRAKKIHITTIFKQERQLQPEEIGHEAKGSKEKVIEKSN